MTSTVDATAPPATTATSRAFPLRLATGAIGLLLVLGAVWLPIWRAHLIAPQYPGGLHIYAFGHGMEGDIEEVDALNHYIGMRAFDPADVPEMALWPLGVGLAFVSVAVATVARRRWQVLIARGYLWAFPIVILADIQLRLYQYGHDLDPGAALRIPEFTPWAIGPTRVWNFTNVAYPGTGLLALLGAAALITAGPWAFTRLQERTARRSSTPAASVLALMLITGVLTTSPAGATAVDASDLASRVAGARAGEVIVVDGGVHHGNLVIDVPVELVGRNEPVIHGDGTGSALVIRAPGTSVSGFSVSGSGPGPVGAPAAIRIEADEVTVTDTEVSDAYIGIAVMGSESVRLVDNVVRGRHRADVGDEGHVTAADHHDDHEVPARGARRLRGDAISIWDSEHVLVRDNTIVDGRDGIYLSFGHHVLVDRNVISGSRYGVHSMYSKDLTLVENQISGNLSGAVVMYGGPALVLRNLISGNRSASTGFGVLLKDVVGVEAVENVLVDNRVGFHLEGPSHGEQESRIHRNTVARNQIGAMLPSSARATFSANSFVDNLQHVGASGLGAGANVEWTEHGWGNFWSGYHGEEIGDMGRGATPHHEGSRVDGLLERAPVLAALAASPGVRLMRAVESRRFAADPVVVDPLPLVRPVSPPLPPTGQDGTGPLFAAGIALLAGVAAATTRLLVPRTPRWRFVP